LIKDSSFDNLNISKGMLQLYKNKILVIKFGGSIMHSEKEKEGFIEDLIFLKSLGIKFILVHGGGQYISKRLESLGIETYFSSGYRVTDKDVVKEVEMVLSDINKTLTMQFTNKGIKAIGLNGKDGGMIQAVKMTLKANPAVDLGSVGKIISIDTSLLSILLSEGYLPIIAPIGYDTDGNTYNINADDVAGKLARALNADQLIMMTDVNGLYEVFGDDSTFIKNISVEKANQYIVSGILHGGMIPKITSCLDAVMNGTRSAQIINGCIKHGLILTLLSKGSIGTIIEGEKECIISIS
jgi:acetylglutamate kinase